MESVAGITWNRWPECRGICSDLLKKNPAGLFHGCPLVRILQRDHRHIIFVALVKNTEKAGCIVMVGRCLLLQLRELPGRRRGKDVHQDSLLPHHRHLDLIGDIHHREESNQSVNLINDPLHSNMTDSPDATAKASNCFAKNGRSFSIRFLPWLIG